MKKVNALHMYNWFSIMYFSTIIFLQPYSPNHGNSLYHSKPRTTFSTSRGGRCVDFGELSILCHVLLF